MSKCLVFSRRLGWVLRELSVADQGAVIAFVETHRHELSKEAFKREIGRIPDMGIL